MTRLPSLPKLAQEIIDSNQRVLDSLEGKEDTTSERRRAARAARQLLRFTLNRAPDARELWELALEILRDGIGGEEAKAMVELSCVSLASWLALAEKAREVWREVQTETAAVPEGLENLGRAEATIRASLAEAERTRAFLCRPRRPVEAERLAKGLEDAQQGRLGKAEDVCSRISTPAK